MAWLSDQRQGAVQSERSTSGRRHGDRNGCHRLVDCNPVNIIAGTRGGTLPRRNVPLESHQQEKFTIHRSNVCVEFCVREQPLAGWLYRIAPARESVDFAVITY
ncbi:MAG: hypothetical protein P8L85_12940 [Rubripirellula sp.]|nr:hypothetical protein [Rubripirellula sp.]